MAHLGVSTKAALTLCCFLDVTLVLKWTLEWGLSESDSYSLFARTNTEPETRVFVVCRHRMRQKSFKPSWVDVRGGISVAVVKLYGGVSKKWLDFLLLTLLCLVLERKRKFEKCISSLWLTFVHFKWQISAKILIWLSELHSFDFETG